MNQYLAGLVKSAEKSPSHLDMSLITRAWEFSHLAHTGQKRLSGDPFISHPTQVAKTLIAWNLDTTTVVAGLLHDTIEDGGATREDLISAFGEDVGLIVDGVSKITDIRLVNSAQEQFVENLRKMLLIMARDLRVILVKLADRLHNMQTLKYLSFEKQIANSVETLEIYSPLAERLGMGEIKGQLEDLAFPFVYPSEYKNLSARTGKLFSEGMAYVEKFRRRLLSILQPPIPGIVINTRHKHLYSLYKKLQRPEINGDLEKIYDIVAARVLVDTVEECYHALGLIHGQFRPVPFLGIRDFIATPKPNGYRSIHTNVFGLQGRIVEIQIRTRQMHEEAEMGIAAHWQYSQNKSHGASDAKLESGVFVPGNKLNWVRQLVAWQKEFTDSREYLDALKFDALQHRILVFSPLGDVYDLPRGATPVDYAFSVHTKLGYQAAGAKVNGKLVALDYLLNNGDTVEIILDRNKKNPSRDWLNFVVTTSARREISKSSKV